ncbi:hypothetical protein [Litoreibacter roseus]|uniref:Lipoprotein n=1 Tax=Litoreibacter roseus TaxID=2601869 RepID=A0A6N6JDW7_9RHOB|nr:hypothetical protein [Litoreibacter roseus]GFE64533.1 hypothetical protein KIN_16070 [Litoreibacter roseus]
MVRFLSSAVLLFGLASCADQQVADKETMAVMPPTGSVEAARLVSVFNEACLSHFPNDEAIVAAFQSSGFSIVEEPLDDFEHDFWRLSNGEGDLSAISGRSILWWHGPDGEGGADQIHICHVDAELSDPELVESALEDLMNSTGERVELFQSEKVSSLRQGTMRNSFGVFQVSFSQSKVVRKTYQGKRPEECDGLEKCLIWGRSELKIERVNS